MKSEIKEKGSVLRKEYPWIAAHKDEHGLIVLFIKKDTGICLHNSINTHNPIGELENDWSELEFDIFTGTIILSN